MRRCRSIDLPKRNYGHLNLIASNAPRKFYLATIPSVYPPPPARQRALNLDLTLTTPPTRCGTDLHCHVHAGLSADRKVSGETTGGCRLSLLPLGLAATEPHAGFRCLDLGRSTLIGAHHPHFLSVHFKFPSPDFRRHVKRKALTPAPQ